MTVFRWNSLQDLFAIQEKVNRLFEETIHRTEFPDEGMDAALWSPAADVYESPDEIVLNIELPGVRLEDVRLEALDGKIRVAGHRRADDGIEARHFVRMERIYGSFSRDFPVPVSVDPGLIKATLRAGVLRVVAPKADGGQPIPVEPRKAR
ncbi:MAG TPA: Hsp20/alpha crystallin family protein [Thermoanaerobaculia bacterium]|nr:Hsp20/alpha crystallin family protein [Thermoanaerobaculia bacterium]